MSIEGQQLDQWTSVVDESTGETGLFLGWTDDGHALVWVDGADGAEERNPDDLDVRWVTS